MKKSQDRLELQNAMDVLTTKNRKGLLKNLIYSKKFSAGRIIGLQNILPEFAEQAEVVFFTNNFMVAELHEIDVSELREAVTEDKDCLR